MITPPTLVWTSPHARVYYFKPNIHGWKRSRGRTRTRWVDSIKHDLHSTGPFLILSSSFRVPPFLPGILVNFGSGPTVGSDWLDLVLMPVSRSFQHLTAVGSIFVISSWCHHLLTVDVLSHHVSASSDVVLCLFFAILSTGVPCFGLALSLTCGTSPHKLHSLPVSLHSLLLCSLFSEHTKQFGRLLVQLAATS